MSENRVGRSPDKPDLQNSLNAYQAGRDALLAEISAAVAADGRFVAAWLSGKPWRCRRGSLSPIEIVLNLVGDET